MRLAKRLLGALLVLVFIAFLTVGAGLAYLLGTESGQALVSRQTQSAVSRVLGSNYAADLGEQSVRLRADGTLAVQWSGVTLHRTDRPEAPSKIDHIALALRLRPLVGGSLALGRLEIDGGRIDLSAFAEDPERRQTVPQPQAPEVRRSILSRLVDRSVRTLERQLETLRTLQFETLAFTNIEIEGIPRLDGRDADARVHYSELKREGDGSLAFNGSFHIGRLPFSVSSNSSFSEAGSLERLSLRSGPIDLGTILPPAPLSDERDDRPFGSDADIGFTLAMAREEGGELVSDITIRSGPGALQTGRNRTRVEEIELNLQHRSGEEKLQLLKSPMRFAGVEFEAEGFLEPVIARDGEASANRLHFRLGSGEVRSRAGAVGDAAATEALTASFWIDGTLNARRRRLELSSLSFSSDGGNLNGQGTFRFGSPVARSTFSVESERVDVATVKAFWPFNLGGGARRWVLAHVGDEGVVEEARIALDLSLHRLATAFKPEEELEPEELLVDLLARGASVSLPGSLPAVREASGRLEGRGATTTILVNEARIAGRESLRIEPSALVLSKVTEIPEGALDLDMEIVAAGEARELLAVADEDPIRALRAVDIEPAEASGTGRVTARAAMRFGWLVPQSEQLRDWSVSAELIDASPGREIEGQRFANLTGSLDVVPGLVTGDLSGTMNETPAALRLQIPFAGNEETGNRVEIDLSLSESDAERTVPALAAYLSGPTEAELVREAGALTATIDLTPTELSLPMLAWRKGPGVPATVEVDVARSEGETALNDLRLSGSGFSAAGSAAIDEGGLRRLSLTGLALNPGDDVDLELRRQGNQLSITVEGRSFDARPLLQELKNAGSKASEEGKQTIDVFASVDRLTGFNGRAIDGFDLNYTSRDGRIAALSVAGSLGAGAVTADVSPRGERKAISVSTVDAGALLSFSGIYPRMEGGTARLQLSGAPGNDFVGQLRMQDFTLVDEPRLENIVGSSPAPGGTSLSQAVGRDLRTSRAFFDQASVNLAYVDGRLTVANGIVRGPVFGSSFEGVLYDPSGAIDISGSFMPAYGLNRLFGAIPLVGQILGNGNEGGLLGITYRLSGAFASPTLTINPISIIAPGIFRQIFEY